MWANNTALRLEGEEQRDDCFRFYTHFLKATAGYLPTP